jgi:two-component system phosphate regulon response regulator OmpR
MLDPSTFRLPASNCRAARKDRALQTLLTRGSAIAESRPAAAPLASISPPAKTTGQSRSVQIAVCDADTMQGTAIAAYLAEHGFTVTSVASAYRLERLLADRGADLVILDADLTESDAFVLARRLSARSRLGLLMLAGGPDCLARICSLEAGADDCLAKPAEPREVLARVKAILRRLAKVDEAERQRRDADGVAFGDCRFDLAARRLTGASGSEIALTEMEIDLLRVFAEHPNRALTRDVLAELAYGRGWTPFDRSLDIRISRLRRKLEADAARPQVIVTVRGIGYRFEAG